MARFIVEFTVSKSPEFECDGDDLESALDDALIGHDLGYTNSDDVVFDHIACIECGYELDLFGITWRDKLVCPTCDA